MVSLNDKKVLLVSATFLEIEHFFNQLSKQEYLKNQSPLYRTKNPNLDIFIGGIGSVSTVFGLQRILNKNAYDCVVNTGFCGSFSENIFIGDIVNIVEDQFADLGMEHPEGFRTLFDAGFANFDDHPFTQGKLLASFYPEEFAHIKKVNGITVNSVTGIASTYEDRKRKFRADTESMEGAACFYVCVQEKIPVAQIRIISNTINERSLQKWDIRQAKSQLSQFLLTVFNGNSIV